MLEGFPVAAQQYLSSGRGPS